MNKISCLFGLFVLIVYFGCLIRILNFELAVSYLYLNSQVGRALGKYHDEGERPDICLTLPDTCENGGTMAVWLKIRRDADNVIDSTAGQNSRGFAITKVTER